MTIVCVCKRAMFLVEIMKVFSSKFPGVHFPRYVYANVHPARIPFSSSYLYISFSLFHFSFSFPRFYIHVRVQVKSCTPAPAISTACFWFYTCALQSMYLLSYIVYIPTCKCICTHAHAFLYTPRLQGPKHTMYENFMACPRALLYFIYYLYRT